jgi:SNF2 family DNA or RNA helicase
MPLLKRAIRILMKTPRPYQASAAQFASKRNLLLADECGLGKTLTAITAAQNAGAKTVLVVCPLRVRAQWIVEIADQAPRDRVQLHMYGVPFQHYKHKDGWFITHYEAARDDASLASRLWDFMIIDEAHRIKNRNAQWTRELKHIPSVRKMALTGTPMEKTPADLWSLLNWLYPGSYRSYWRFYEKYVDYVVEGWQRKYRVIRGPKNTRQLGKELSRTYLRRTKKEVEPDLPPRIEQKIYIPMYEPQDKVYSEIYESKDILLEYEGTEMFIPNALALFSKLHQVSVLPEAIGLNILSSKMTWLWDWLDDNPDPVIIFSKYRKVIEYVASEIGCPTIVGGVREVPKSFLDGTDRVVAGTISAMGEGLNLQKAEVAIFLDQEWSATMMTQAIDRIHRIGIDSPKLVYYLTSSRTDDHVLKSVKEKWSNSEMIHEAVRSNVL